MHCAVRRSLFRWIRSGDDTIGNPHRDQIFQFEFFEFLILVELDNNYQSSNSSQQYLSQQYPPPLTERLLAELGTYRRGTFLSEAGTQRYKRDEVSPCGPASIPLDFPSLRHFPHREQRSNLVVSIRSGSNIYACVYNTCNKLLHVRTFVLEHNVVQMQMQRSAL